ncbi:MAG: DNA ligase-associated DEXH box helicase [Ponticaulis sp.]|nr:DNA ligase-associated DEXH box helicase [Ponticaulis sp.]|tara:strand:+ start:196 stop:2700 length:2505 start_codon:yes stop_codon:yes gene_type:complete
MADGSSRIFLPDQFEDWFASRGWSPRPHQLALVDAAMRDESALLIAPTGAGKTLAGFLPSLIDLTNRKKHRNDKIPALHTLYISPLKALAVDVHRNLKVPVDDMDLDVRIETRTGDTPQSRRQRQRANPPDILLTTPEQLALFIASDRASEFFADLKCVIIDEIHAIAPTKRGDLMALGLSTLKAWAPNLRLTGLSATVADPGQLTHWMGGATTITATGGANADIDLLISKERIPWSGHSGRFAIPEVYEQIKDARLALLFVNTRSQAEMLFQELWRANEDSLPIALHHGSLDVEQRRKVEAAMARGALKAVVCTSTLDLGIDWGDVDLVIQMGAPKGSSRLIQRIGRANHRLDESSRAILVPTNRFEVLECRAAKEAVDARELDGPDRTQGGLDVLAQHVMGRACGEGFDMERLYAEITSVAPYAHIDWETFERIIDLVATGGYALKTYDRFRRIVKRKEDGLWHARTARDAQGHRLNVGTIIEAQMLKVRVTNKPRRDTNGRLVAGPMAGGRVLGEIEEGFIDSLTPGDTFLFGGQVLCFEGIVETTAVTTPSSDPEPAIPSYAGGKFPLSTFLADRVRRILQNEEGWDKLPEQVAEWIRIQKLRSIIPPADQMLVETFPRAGRHYLICYPFDGRLAQQSLGMLLTRRLERWGYRPLGFVASEYAMAIWCLEPMGGLDMTKLFDQDMLGDDLEEWLDESFMMKRTFTQCAQIAGLILRRQPGTEKTGRQVTFSTDLIYDVLRTHEPDHILLQAAREEAAEGQLDIRRLARLLERVKGHIAHVDLPKISPFAVPVMLEVGREPVAGVSAAEAILHEAEEDLLAEAFGDDVPGG